MTVTQIDATKKQMLEAIRQVEQLIEDGAVTSLALATAHEDGSAGSYFGVGLGDSVFHLLGALSDVNHRVLRAIEDK
jgi:hypothetical protein